MSVEVLGATLDEVKEALAILVKDFDNEEVIGMLENDELSLHENYLENKGRIVMAYWKGDCDFTYTLSRALPEALVVCNDDGWRGVDICVVAKNGEKAIPGVDYIGDMEYCENQDFDEEEDEGTYYEVDLQIMDCRGNKTSVGGGMISEEDKENFKEWANKVKRVETINWERNSKMGD